MGMQPIALLLLLQGLNDDLFLSNLGVQSLSESLFGPVKLIRLSDDHAWIQVSQEMDDISLGLSIEVGTARQKSQRGC
ncbi:unnamed protein product [Caretta caretta]